MNIITVIVSQCEICNIFYFPYDRHSNGAMFCSLLGYNKTLESCGYSGAGQLVAMVAVMATIRLQP